MQRGVQGFAKFDPAAGQRIKPVGWRSRAPHQQDLVVTEDRSTDGKLGMLRRVEAGAISERAASTDACDGGLAD